MIGAKLISLRLPWRSQGLPLCQACSRRLQQFKQPTFISRHSTTYSVPPQYETHNRSTIVNSFPKSARPYLQLARWDRPIGHWLLFWPCAWSIGLTAPGGTIPSLSMLALFGAGSVVMRGAGCTINDLWDRDFDGKVFRTSSRPIPSGKISSFNALLFLGGQLTVGLSILLSLNTYSIILGAASVPLVILYPLMKRYTFWPQLVLGLTINWGALLGYAAVKGYCDWSVCMPLYLGCVSWTMFYDTIYAYQDTSDDAKLGLKSTALLFGDRGKLWLTGFAASMSSCLLLVGLNSSITWPYYMGVAAVTSHLLWQIKSVDLGNPVDCLRKFRSNTHIGMFLLLGITGALLITAPDDDDPDDKRPALFVKKQN